MIEYRQASKKREREARNARTGYVHTQLRSKPKEMRAFGHTKQAYTQPTVLMKKRCLQSLMDKKCGKEFEAWNGGITYALYEAKSGHWNGSCLPKGEPDSIKTRDSGV